MKHKILLLTFFISAIGVVMASNPGNLIDKPASNSPSKPAVIEITDLLPFYFGFAAGYQVYTNASVQYEVINGNKVPVRFDYLGGGIYTTPVDIITSYTRDEGNEPESYYYSGSYTYKTSSGATYTDYFRVAASEVTILDDKIILTNPY